MVEHGKTIQMMETKRLLDQQFHFGFRISDFGLLIRHSILRNPQSKGFTLIEVISMMILIGILAVVLIPRMDYTLSGAASVAGAADMIASDIRYAQECAMANRVSKSITFISGQGTYTFPATVPSTRQLDPSGQLPSGTTIGTTLTITFNSLGEPISIPVGTGFVTISISGTGGAKTITVSNYTGKVDIS